jgi:hypothetical protein
VHQQRQSDGARLVIGLTNNNLAIPVGRNSISLASMQLCMHRYGGSIFFLSRLCPAAQLCPATKAAAGGCHQNTSPLLLPLLLLCKQQLICIPG